MSTLTTEEFERKFSEATLLRLKDVTGQLWITNLGDRAQLRAVFVERDELKSEVERLKIFQESHRRLMDVFAMIADASGADGSNWRNVGPEERATTQLQKMKADLAASRDREAVLREALGEVKSFIDSIRWDETQSERELQLKCDAADKYAIPVLADTDKSAAEWRAKVLNPLKDVLWDALDVLRQESFDEGDLSGLAEHILATLKAVGATR